MTELIRDRLDRIVEEVWWEEGRTENRIDFSYDAIGNVTSKDVRGTALDPPLTYTYDAAGRLIQIEEHDAETGLRPLKAFRYARNNSGTRCTACHA